MVLMSIQNKLYFCTYVIIVHVYVLSMHQNRLGETALACIWNIFSNGTCWYKKMWLSLGSNRYRVGGFMICVCILWREHPKAHRKRFYGEFGNRTWWGVPNELLVLFPFGTTSKSHRKQVISSSLAEFIHKLFRVSFTTNYNYAFCIMD